MKCPTKILFAAVVMLLISVVPASADNFVYTYNGPAWTIATSCGFGCTIPVGDYITMSFTASSQLAANLSDVGLNLSGQTWSIGFNAAVGLTPNKFGSAVFGSCASDNVSCGSIASGNQGPDAIWTDSTGKIKGWLLAGFNQFDNWGYYVDNAGGLGGGSEYDQFKHGIGTYQSPAVSARNPATWSLYDSTTGQTVWTESFPAPAVPEPASLILFVTVLLLTLRLVKRRRTQ